MAKKKYKLTDEFIELEDGRKLYRIEALRDFDDVKAGEKGGYVESEANLSHDGNAWVYGTAKVYDNAWVCNNAWVCGSAEVYDNAWVCDNAWDIMTASHIGSRCDTTTAFRTKDGGVSVSCGCFYGTLEEFAARVNEVHGDNKYGREYKAFIEMCKAHFDVEFDVE